MPGGAEQGLKYYLMPGCAELTSLVNPMLIHHAKWICLYVPATNLFGIHLMCQYVHIFPKYSHMVICQSQSTILIGRKMQFLERETNRNLGIPCSQLILQNAHFVPWVSTTLSRKPILTFSWSIDGLWPCAIHCLRCTKILCAHLEINWSLVGSEIWTALSNLIS